MSWKAELKILNKHFIGEYGIIAIHHSSKVGCFITWTRNRIFHRTTSILRVTS
jgi:hypothetical protein